MLALSIEDTHKGEDMLATLRADLISVLWSNYLNEIEYFTDIFGDNTPNLDHFAVIDLRSKHSGIRPLVKIFELLEFELAGSGYLPEKSNDFVWMREPGFMSQPINSCLPQIVLADFRTELLSAEVQNILSKYTDQVQEFDLSTLETMVKALKNGDKTAHKNIIKRISSYTNQRPWSLPTIEDYQDVRAENELIAWVLLMGRKINHFGVQINGYDNFRDLSCFLKYIKESNLSKINKIHGEIKGSVVDGIAQASSLGEEITASAANGDVITNNSFMEFVWRYPKSSSPPKLNIDQHTEFVAKNANYVIESLLNG